MPNKQQIVPIIILFFHSSLISKKKRLLSDFLILELYYFWTLKWNILLFFQSNISLLIGFCFCPNNTCENVNLPFRISQLVVSTRFFAVYCNNTSFAASCFVCFLKTKRNYVKCLTYRKFSNARKVLPKNISFSLNYFLYMKLLSLRPLSSRHCPLSLENV